MKALLSALMLSVFAVVAAGTATTAHTRIVAQASPEPTDTPSGMPSPTDTPTSAPAMPATPASETTPMPAAPAAPTTIDVKQGGTTTNSNGPNWLDKFNRNPGPDTSNVIHGGTVPMNKTKPMTKKARPHPMPTKKP